MTDGQSVPLLAGWRAEHPAGGVIASVETHTVFGWRVQRHDMPPGAVMLVRALVEVPRAAAPNRAMYVQGRATVTVDGASYDDRVPGTYSHERPAQPAGDAVVTAVEHTVFWCFNHGMNRRALPQLTPIRLAPGQARVFDAGDKVFVMQGGADAPCTFVASAGQVYTALDAAFAFIIDKERA